jgi:hypothetical protein
VWPRWKQTPPDHGESEFISDQPFFDIDEISQKAKFYPPGQPLVDKNIGGNPASRQRVGHIPGVNFFRRRLLVVARATAKPTHIGSAVLASHSMSISAMQMSRAA